MQRLKPLFSTGAVKKYENDALVALVLALEVVMSKYARAHYCGRHKQVLEKAKTSPDSPGKGAKKPQLFSRVLGR